MSFHMQVCRSLSLVYSVHHILRCYCMVGSVLLYPSEYFMKFVSWYYGRQATTFYFKLYLVDTLLPISSSVNACSLVVFA